MKKLYAFMMLLAIGSCVFAQVRRGHQVSTFDGAKAALNYNLADAMAKAGNYNYKMIGYHSDDEIEWVNYHYDADNKIIAIYTLVMSEYETYDSLRYDEKGDIVRIDEYQLFGTEYRYVNYVDYTYDDNHHMTSRTNYNNISGEWTLGGVYTYTYNEHGNIVKSVLEFAGYDEYEIIDYIYDNQNRLVRAIWQQTDMFTGQRNYTDAFHYTYNANGKLEMAVDSTYDNGHWSYHTKELYEYDGNGNCVRYQKMQGASNRVVTKSEYWYDDRTVAETLIPQVPENDRPNIYTNNNLYTGEHWYSLDDNGDLQLICDYLYGYAGYAGIESIEAASISVYPNPAVEQATVNAPAGSKISVVDVQGRVVEQFEMTAESRVLNLKNYNPGLYVLQVMGAKSSARLLVK